MGIDRIITTTVLILALIIISTTTASAIVSDLSCDCGDICVNETGWWRDGGVLNASGTPIQAAVGNATAGDTICVAAGSYTENVNVNKRLTLEGEGAGVVTVIAADYTDDVFKVTADYVNISGFYVTTDTTGYMEAGIYLYRADHCNISYNNVSNNDYGIFLELSSGNTLASNTANSNNYFGTRLYKSSGNTLVSNTASNSGQAGIFLYDSSNNTLTSNTVDNTRDNGIYLHDSSNNTLTSNNASSNEDFGILLKESSNNTLASNTMSGNTYNFGVYGSSLSRYTQNIDTSNTVDEKPIYYWVDPKDKQIPSDAGFVGVVNGTNITVRDLTLTNNSYGVLFANTGNSRIENVTADSNNNYGILLDYSSNNNTLTSNNASNNDEGILLDSSSNNTLTSNNASNNVGGIELESSSNNTLTSNTASSNRYRGIYLGYSSNNTLASNTADSNEDFGILLDSSSNNTLTSNTASSNNYSGITLYSSSNNTLASNTADSNNRYGIELESSSNNNTLTSNTADSNNYYGIRLYSSSNDNLVYNNCFNNTNNAYDNGNNQWNITKTNGTNIIGGPFLGGNYWSDYAGVDNNGDGLGDTILPYNSSGNITNGGDFHPLTASAAVLSCACGDICVDTTGWWRDGGSLNANTTPIQAAVDNATAGETICVTAGSYTENVNVNKRLTLAGEGAGVVTVTATDLNDHVFEVTTDYVNISGFNATGAIVSKAGIYLDSADHCDIYENAASGNDYGIYLSDSSSNTLANNTANSNDWVGIYLNSSSSNTLTNNTASNNFDSGIRLDSSSSNTLTNNTANLNSGYGGYGIYLTSSNNDNTLTGNTANSNDNYGIYLEYSSNNTLTSNTASNNHEGISLQGSSNDNTLTGNTVSSNSYGIYLQGSSSNTLTENNFSNNNVDGILMVSSSDNLIYNNYFNNTNNANDDGNNQWNTTKTSRTNIIGGPYLGGNYWSDYAGVDTDGDGLGDTMLPYNSSGKIIYGGDFHPLIASTLCNCTCGDICVNETGWWRDGGAFVANTTSIQAAVDNANVGDVICVAAGNYIENVNVAKRLTLAGEDAGVVTVTAADYNDHVFEVTANYVSISGFTATGAIGASKAGIYLNDVDYCNIYENTASNNAYGIRLHSSDRNTLANNTARSNYDGISLKSSSRNTLANNTASNNNCGIYLSSSSNYNRLANNTASNNDYGIRLFDSSNYNLIYNNYFNNTYNAYDHDDNQWNTTKTSGTNIIGGPYLGGNYWSDYAGVDNDGDGLGDTLLPYNSSGDIQNGGDLHPLTDATPPAVTVLKPDGGEEIPGDSVYDITWNVTAGTYDLAAGPISISYSNDSGTTWNSIASNELNDGRYSWSVPNINSSNCTVNVTARDVNGNTGSDVSNSTFTILETDNSTSETISEGETETVEGPPESNTTVNVNASGDVTVTVAYYNETPHPGATEPDGMVPKYIDIAFSNNDNVTWPIYVEVHYTDDEVEGLNESSLGLYYYKDGEWIRCNDTGVNVDENYIWANVEKEECPGSPFGTGGALDDTPPVITITTPEPDGIYTVGMTLDFSATDSESGVDTIEGNLTNTSGVSQNVNSGDAPAVGVYTLVVTATDNAGNTNVSDPVFFVVYDPDSGSATGEGWFDPDVESLTKADFEFAVKYKKDVSTGKLDFKDEDADIKLKSTSIDWLVISSVSAQFQGNGTINGTGLYTFRVQAKDNGKPGVDLDHFDIKIWDGTNTEADPIYEANNTIADGDIKVLTK